jgi:hypothetical protein
MRTARKERLKLVLTMAFLSLVGLAALKQVSHAFLDGMILGVFPFPAPRWVSFAGEPLQFALSVVVAVAFLSFWIFALASVLFGHRWEKRWRARQFVDRAIRRPSRSEREQGR